MNPENVVPWKCGEDNSQTPPKSNTSYRVGVNLRASAYLHQGDRKYMEDEFQVAYQRTCDKKDIEYAFFGIFDGHGGKEAANFAKDHLMDNIVSLRSFWSDNDEDVLSAIKEGFIQTHLAMWKMLDKWPRTASGWPSTSGTTASIAFIRRQKIYIGHVGDSAIVLGYEDDEDEWIGEFLTRDHKPESADEKARINECGGKVVSKSGVPRIVWNRPKSGHSGPVRRSTPMDEIPFLAVARSLGDLWSYNANNNQFVVSPEPDVCVVDIDISRHRCLIFGTDGLWNVLSPTSAVHIAYYTEKNNEMHYLGNALSSGKQRLWINPSRSIVKTGALERYQKVNLRADNTSAVTVFLDPPGPPKREVLLQRLKGMEDKEVASSSLKEPSREASVQVHVYNLNPEDRNRSMFRIKERVPEDWQNKDDSWNSFQDAYDPIGPSSSSSSPTFSSSDASNDKYSLSSSASCHKDSVLNDNLDNKGATDSVAKCSECGCSNKLNLVATRADSISKEPDDYIKGATSSDYIKGATSSDYIKGATSSDDIKGAASSSVPSRDDIQIPVVSSSTAKVAFKDVAETRAKKGSRAPTREGMNRRTRSCIPLLPSKSENKPAQNKSTLWKGPQAAESKASSSRRRSMGDLSAGNTTGRVLRSINGAHNFALAPLAGAKYTSSQKRKRPKELLSCEPDSKTARMHTRSHTWTHKSIVTRSQDKTKKSKPK